MSWQVKNRNKLSGSIAILKYYEVSLCYRTGSLYHIYTYIMYYIYSNNQHQCSTSKYDTCYITMYIHVSVRLE